MHYIRKDEITIVLCLSKKHLGWNSFMIIVIKKYHQLVEGLWQIAIRVECFRCI